MNLLNDAQVLSVAGGGLTAENTEAAGGALLEIGGGIVAMAAGGAMVAISGFLLAGYGAYQLGGAIHDMVCSHK